jgi:hypothetical protein
MLFLADKWRSPSGKSIINRPAVPLLLGAWS